MKKTIILPVLLALSFVSASFTCFHNVVPKENNISLEMSETLIDKIKVKIKNASKKNTTVYYKQTKTNGGRGTSIGISSNSMATIEIAVGGAVYSKEGALLLVITADMANTTQTVLR
jgi:hypothetical protein